ncbi:hypothetical protein B0H14DRAFT_3047710 [Mycena olivaceomarginata]|nr:hypothetical protein B0H14DRAFT_3047710 [Mycena olivaceomarginata]
MPFISLPCAAVPCLLLSSPYRIAAPSQKPGPHHTTSAQTPPQLCLHDEFHVRTQLADPGTIHFFSRPRASHGLHASHGSHP